MSEKTRIAYLHYRSYGDLVINLFCRKFYVIDSIDYVSFYLIDLFKLISDHSKDLVTLENINTKPAFINFKKSGFIETIKSAKQLRQVFKKIKYEFPDHLIFQDYKRWQQDIYFNTFTYTPKQLKNVYISHLSFYQNLGMKAKTPISRDFKSDSIIRIFPYSSSNHKNIKPGILRSVCDHLNFLKKPYEVIYLDDEKIFDFKHNYSKIPRTFGHLIAKLKYSSLNISCDSLPAHLSSFYNIDTLVLISEKSKYWLPLNSFSNKNYVTLESLQDGNLSNLFKMVDWNCLN
ncbi:hypothetical protein OAO38_05235, partial [Candidatus Pelagibacter ubique]|nr:hypothetical protein [Candidatus Pelagibacter ubique]